MKISEMPAERGFEVMARLAPLAARMIQLDDLKQAKAELPEQATGYDVIGTFMPVLLQHADLLISMAAIMEGVPVEDMKQRPVGEIIKLFDGETINEIMSFFPFARGLVYRV